MANAEYEVAVVVRKNGKPVEGLDPYYARFTVQEEAGLGHKEATGGGYLTLPIDKISTVEFAAIRPTGELSLRFQAQTDGGLVVEANGLFLLVKGRVNSAPTTNIKASNASGADVKIDGVVGGP